MQFSVIASLALASLAAADTVLTQIGDGQIQAPTTQNQQTTATATTPAETSTSTTASSGVPHFSNAAPKAVIGGGVVALAGLAALL